LPQGAARLGRGIESFILISRNVAPPIKWVEGRMRRETVAERPCTQSVGDCTIEARRVILAHAFPATAQVHADLFGRARVLQRHGDPANRVEAESEGIQAYRIARGHDPPPDRRL